jgi:hypothetical protein
MDFKTRDEIRTTHELLQYLCIIGTAPLNYWLNKSDIPFGTFFSEVTAASKQIPHEKFLSIMDEQIEMTGKLFDQINELQWGKPLFAPILNFYRLISSSFFCILNYAVIKNWEQQMHGY